MSFVLLPIVIFFTLFTITTAQNVYGKYRIVWKKFETCKGPMNEDCAYLIVENVNFSDMSNIFVKLNVTEGCYITKGFIAVNITNNKVRRKFLTKSIETPCQHYLFGPYVSYYTDKTMLPACYAKKGIYSYNVTLIKDINKHAGKEFFYGNYSVKVVLNNNKKNLGCLSLKMEFIRAE